MGEAIHRISSIGGGVHIDGTKLRGLAELLSTGQSEEVTITNLGISLILDGIGIELQKFGDELDDIGVQQFQEHRKAKEGLKAH